MSTAYLLIELQVIWRIENLDMAHALDTWWERYCEIKEQQRQIAHAAKRLLQAKLYAMTMVPLPLSQLQLMQLPTGMGQMDKKRNRHEAGNEAVHPPNEAARDVRCPKQNTSQGDRLLLMCRLILNIGLGPS